MAYHEKSTGFESTPKRRDLLPSVNTRVGVHWRIFGNVSLACCELSCL